MEIELYLNSYLYELGVNLVCLALFLKSKPHVQSITLQRVRIEKQQQQQTVYLVDFYARLLKNVEYGYFTLCTKNGTAKSMQRILFFYFLQNPVLTCGSLIVRTSSNTAAFTALKYFFNLNWLFYFFTWTMLLLKV